MSTKIRLARGGRKNIPYFKVIVADSRSKRDGKFIEQIGKYNPLLPDDDSNRFVINKERAQYWLSIGSKPSERLAILLSKAGIKEAEKYKSKFVPGKSGEKKKKKDAGTTEVVSTPTEAKTE